MHDPQVSMPVFGMAYEAAGRISINHLVMFFEVDIGNVSGAEGLVCM